MASLDILAYGLEIEKLIELARYAETSERYKDMLEFMTKVVELKSSKSQVLDIDERNLFSVACKNVVGVKRASWRTMSACFDDADVEIKNMVNKYKIIIENELENICTEIVTMYAKHLYENVKGNNDEPETFYLCKVADYYRYLTEFATDSKRDEYKNNASAYYTKAMCIAEIKLSPIHRTRLGLALNFSVFYWEILKEPEKACGLAKKSFDSALENLDNVCEEDYRDCTLIMQLLRDNITLWTSVDDDNDDNDDNDGIDISKYGKRVKATRHDANNEQDMHDMRADMKRLGLMAQNKDDADNIMDAVRHNLHDIFVMINDNGAGGSGLYKDIINLILQYEAYIDLSRFKCYNDQCMGIMGYFGCEIFDNLCSDCYSQKNGYSIMKRKCLDNMETIVIRVEWDRINDNRRYFSMISMASLCSVKILFKILNSNSYRCNALDLMDPELNRKTLEKCSYLENEENVDEELKQKRLMNDKCITDFGIIDLAAMLLR